ncbi:MAG: ABC transporter permease [Acidimicrobiales bacterium]
MKLALRELVRKPGRFALAGAVLTLIALLLMFLGGLLDGLLNASTGAYRAQQADRIVYSESAKSSLVRSRITPEERQQVEAAVGDGKVGGLGSVQLGARMEGRGPRDLIPVALFGYEIPPKGLPTPPSKDGQVYADRSLQREDVKVGTQLLLGPARTPVEVIGWIDDAQYSGQGTLWGSLDTWRNVTSANRPDAAVGDDVVQALVVVDAPSSPASSAAIDRATGGATQALTIDEAINAIPGVSSQQATFNQIIGVTVVIAIVVVALFFALLTVERTALYGVLKAIGARSSTIFGGVVVQAVIVALTASLVGALAALGLAAAIPPGSIPFVALPARLVQSTAYLLVAAIVGCAFSLRRVLRIDPASAIGGSA